MMCFHIEFSRYSWMDSILKWLPSVNGGSISVVETQRDIIQYAKVIIMSYDLLRERCNEPPIKKCGVVILVSF